MAIALFTQLLLPGAGGRGRGTPRAILFRGLVFGLVNALTAAGIILIYRTLRVINFAQTAIGAAGAMLTLQARAVHDGAVPLAFLLGLGSSALVGVAFDCPGAALLQAPRLVLTVVTIVVAGFLSQTSACIVARLPFFPDADTLSLDRRPGDTVHPRPAALRRLPLPGRRATPTASASPRSSPSRWPSSLLLGLAAFFRYTRSGVAVRAMAENTERAALLGISVGALSTIIWGLAGLLAGASVTLTGTLTEPGAAAGFAPGVLLPALAAAVVGRMRQPPHHRVRRRGHLGRDPGDAGSRSTRTWRSSTSACSS